MSTESDSKKTAQKAPQDGQPQPTCGIVMPIAAIGDEYTEEHWRRVRKVLQRAIERAGMKSQLVWENPEVDVIHSAILQNIYENDIVVCDVSGLNPNVMLEAGLRLSTKKPTIIVTDKVVKPPFDIGVVGYIDYQRDLEYNATEVFIDRLRDKIVSVHQAYRDGVYKSFVENFTFETVVPSTVNVTGEEYLKEQIDNLVSAVRRIESRESRSAAPPPKMTGTGALTANIRAVVDVKRSIDVEFALDSMPDFGVSNSIKITDGEYLFTIPLRNPRLTTRVALSRIAEVMESNQVERYTVDFVSS